MGAGRRGSGCSLYQLMESALVVFGGGDDPDPNPTSEARSVYSRIGEIGPVGYQYKMGFNSLVRSAEVIRLLSGDPLDVASNGWSLDR